MYVFSLVHIVTLQIYKELLLWYIAEFSQVSVQPSDGFIMDKSCCSYVCMSVNISVYLSVWLCFLLLCVNLFAPSDSLSLFSVQFHFMIVFSVANALSLIGNIDLLTTNYTTTHPNTILTVVKPDIQAWCQAGQIPEILSEKGYRNENPAKFTISGRISCRTLYILPNIRTHTRLPVGRMAEYII